MRAIGVLAATTATLFALTAPAIASTTPRSEPGVLVINTFRNQASSLCLDDSHAFGPRTFGCNGQNFQQWDVRPLGDGSRELKNVNTSRCLGVTSFGDIYTGGCASRETSWTFTRWGDGTLRWQALAHDRKCLQDNGGRLVLAGCNTSREQSWY